MASVKAVICDQMSLCIVHIWIRCEQQVERGACVSSPNCLALCNRFHLAWNLVISHQSWFEIRIGSRPIFLENNQPCNARPGHSGSWLSVHLMAFKWMKPCRLDTLSTRLHFISQDVNYSSSGPGKCWAFPTNQQGPNSTVLISQTLRWMLMSNWRETGYCNSKRDTITQYTRHCVKLQRTTVSTHVTTDNFCSSGIVRPQQLHTGERLQTQSKLHHLHQRIRLRAAQLWRRATTLWTRQQQKRFSGMLAQWSLSFPWRQCFNVFIV